MKYCYECGKMTPGDPLFCHTCGRSYDVKLCPRLHMNPRGVTCCSKCGSRELSIPQPNIPMSWRLLALMLRLGLAVVLVYASLWVLIALISSPTVQQTLIAFGMLLGVLWLLWTKLPEWLQEAIRSLWKGRSHHDDE